MAAEDVSSFVGAGLTSSVVVDAIGGSEASVPSSVESSVSSEAGFGLGVGSMSSMSCELCTGRRVGRAGEGAGGTIEGVLGWGRGVGKQPPTSDLLLPFPFPPFPLPLPLLLLHFDFFDFIDFGDFLDPFLDLLDFDG